MRHHYAVVATGLAEVPGRRFHTFAEAEDSFQALTDRARAEGRELVAESYWRRVLNGSAGSAVKVALDDLGLVPCNAACGEGT